MVDIFPRRNLPNDAEQWGREVENQTSSNAQSIEIIQQQIQGQNRNTASSLAILSDAIRSIPITTSQSEYLADFAVPATSPDWMQAVKIQIDNPQGRRRLSLFCVGNVRIYENTSPPASFAQVIIRAYNSETNNLIAGGASSPTLRSAQVSDSLHSATPIFATRFTTPAQGIYLTLELQTTTPANFPFDTKNFAELAVQTSFL